MGVLYAELTTLDNTRPLLLSKLTEKSKQNNRQPTDDKPKSGASQRQDSQNVSESKKAVVCVRLKGK